MCMLGRNRKNADRTRKYLKYKRIACGFFKYALIATE